jgi:geranyl-CoA carboxylase beta subunit
MAAIASTVDPGSAAFAENRAAMLALLERVRAIESRVAQVSAAARPRFEQRGQLLPRERLALLLDANAPFLELSTLAGLGLDTPDLDKSVPGGGIIGGIGFVSGVRCMVVASDSGIDAGALQAMGLDKQLRILELALDNGLPFVQLV